MTNGGHYFITQPDFEFREKLFEKRACDFVQLHFEGKLPESSEFIHSTNCRTTSFSNWYIRRIRVWQTHVERCLTYNAFPGGCRMRSQRVCRKTSKVHHAHGVNYALLLCNMKDLHVSLLDYLFSDRMPLRSVRFDTWDFFLFVWKHK